jgi:hypothetical protein
MYWTVFEIQFSVLGFTLSRYSDGVHPTSLLNAEKKLEREENPDWFPMPSMVNVSFLPCSNNSFAY